MIKHKQLADWKRFADVMESAAEDGTYVEIIRELIAEVERLRRGIGEALVMCYEDPDAVNGALRRLDDE